MNIDNEDADFESDSIKDLELLDSLNIKQEADNLVADVKRIVDKFFDDSRYAPAGTITTTNDLIEKLVIYIAERDTKVMIHGINVGGKI